MKRILFLFFILELIGLSFSVVPIWNLKNVGKDIFDQSTKYFSIYEMAVHDNFFVKLSLEITKQQNLIKKKYILEMDYGNYKIENAPWEDIESAYTNKNDKIYICPKGRNHVFVYDINNKNYEELKPQNFDNNNDWELKCYYQHNLGYIFVSYLNSNNNFYQLEILSGKFIYDKSIDQGIYDYKWTTDAINDKYDMIAILLKDNNFVLKDLLFSISSNFTIEEDRERERKITELKSNYKAFFNYDNYHFYWINYNNNKDFTSGYYNSEENFNKYHIDKLNINYNDESPLEFLDDIIIKQINFMPYSKYVYYEIYNNVKKVTYHGIIDIILNKVIFNTDEEIKTFIPFLKNTMLAITEDSAYQICTIDNGYNYCIDKCYNNEQIILDTQKPNKCGSDYNCENFLLMPNKVCIESCDENIFIKKDKQCGLCKDIDKENPYKLLNTTKCFKSPPEGTKIINDNLKLLNCSDGYTLINESCILEECNDLCQTCSEYSEDNENQKCFSCKNDNHVLYNGNCIDKCPDKFYEKNKKCEECDKSCLSCSINSNNCTSCEDGKYLNETNHNCQNCNEHCKTCSKGEENDNENCNSCDQNSNFTYLIKAEGYPSNCVEKCPENITTLEDVKECIIQTGRNENNNLLYVFIIITAILLLIIIICFFKNYCCKSKNSDERLIREINTELIESRRIVD